MFSLQVFLQSGFGIFAGVRRIQIGQIRLKKLQDRLLCRIEAAIEEHRSENGFERIGKNRRALGSAAFALTLAETQMSAKIDGQGNVGKGFLPDEIGAKAGQVSFTDRGELLEQCVRNDAVEDTVAEKLQSLVM